MNRDAAAMTKPEKIELSGTYVVDGFITPEEYNIKLTHRDGIRRYDFDATVQEIIANLRRPQEDHFIDDDGKVWIDSVRRVPSWGDNGI